MDKIRLDKALLNQILSRAKAQDMIKEGKISVNGKVITKASFLVNDEDDIVVTHTEDEFVSRGAFKLKGCLDKYNVNIQNQVVLDIGASTGGFTDVCLRYGAKKVYALDVGHNQLVYKLRNDNRVISIEDFNAKDIKREMFEGETPSIVVSDVSFISISKIAPIIFKELYDLEYWVSLIKPQFEAEKGEVSKGGIIKDDILREKIVNNAINRITAVGFKEINRTISPIKGSKGNIEYLSYFII